jgi:hypothetical protein
MAIMDPIGRNMLAAVGSTGIAQSVNGKSLDATATVVASFFGQIAGADGVDFFYGPPFRRHRDGPLEASHLRLFTSGHAGDGFR